MKTLFLCLLVSTFTQFTNASPQERPPLILSTKICESYLLSRDGERMVKAVQKWFTTLPETALELEHVPIRSLNVYDQRQPYEYFLEENVNRPWKELYSEYQERLIHDFAKRTEDLREIAALPDQEIKMVFATEIAARQNEPLSPVEKVALGLNINQPFTMGEVKEVRVTGHRDALVLVTVNRAGTPRGRVEIPIENVLLGFQNAVASWQAARYLEDPEKFAELGSGVQTVRRFLKDQGRVLIQRSISGVRLGYLFDYDQTTSPVGKPRYINIRIVTLRDCDRPSTETNEMLFPQNEGTIGQMNLCVALTDLALHTPMKL